MAYQDESELTLAQYLSNIETILQAADEEADRHCRLDHGGGEDSEGACLTRKLLIHVHGGLNTRASSLLNAQRAIEKIESEPFSQWHYPIFVSWPTGAFECYREHLFELRAGHHAPFWATLTSPLFLAADLVRGVARLPRSLFYGTTSDIQAASKIAFDVNVLDRHERAELLLAVLDGQRADGDQGVFDAQLGDYGRGAGAQFARFLGYWATLPVTIPMTAVVLDGVGQSAWEVMRHRAQNAAHRVDDIEWEPREDRRFLNSVLQQQPMGGFSLLMRRLNERIEATRRQDNPPVKYEITLVAHSMGAFLINEALALYPDLPVKNIVYMAPACSVAEGAQAIVPFLKHRNEALRLEKAGPEPDGKPVEQVELKEEEQTNFYLLCLHPIAEQDERNLLDLPPRGSLLEWIDNWFEPPSHPLEARMGKWVNAMPTLHLYRDVSTAFHIKGFGVRPESRPQRHGQFNECPFWRSDFWDPEGRKCY